MGPVKLIDPQSQNIVEVPHAEAVEYVKRGYVLAEPVAMLHPQDQKPYDISNPQDFMKYTGEGYTVETKDQKRTRYFQEQYGDNEGLAFAAGAGRGLTFGLSDAVFTAHGVDPKALEGLQEANPVASTVGEVTGAVGGVFIPGGAAALGGKVGRLGGTVGKVGRLVESAGLAAQAASPTYRVSQLGTKTATAARAQLLARLGGEEAGILAQALSTGGGYAAAGAVEGGLYGLGQGVSELSINEETLREENLWNPAGVSELLVTKALEGTIFGAGTGGVLGFGGSLGYQSLKAGKEKLSTLAMKAVNKYNLPERYADKFDGAVGEALGMSGGQQRKALQGDKGQALRETLLADDVLPDGPLVRGNDVKENLANLVDAAEYHGQRIGSVYDVLDNVVDDLAQTPNIQKIQQTLLKEAEALEGVSKVKGKAKIKRDLEELVSEYQKEVSDGKGYMSFKEAIENKQAFNEYAKWTKFETPSAEQKFNRVVSTAIRDEADRAAETLLQSAQLDDATREILIKKGFKPEELEDLFAAYKKSKRVYYALADLAKKAGNGELGQSANSGLLTRLGGVTKDFARGFGYQTLWGRPPAIAAGRAAFGTAMKQFGGKLFSKEPSISKFSRLSVKANMIEEINKLEMKTQKALDKMVSGKPRTLQVPLSSSIFHQLTGEKDKQKAARTLTKQINNLALNPQAMADRLKAVTGSISDAAPMTTQEIEASALHMTQVLASLTPKQKMEPSLQPFLEDDTISADELRAFGEALAVAFQPEKVLDQISTGMITPSLVNAFKTFYPLRYETAKMAIIEMASNKKEKLTQSEKSRLSIFFGVPLSANLTPQRIASAQEAYSEQRAQAQKHNNSAPGRPLSNKAIEQMSSRNLTPNQSLEGGISK